MARSGGAVGASDLGHDHAARLRTLRHRTGSQLYAAVHPHQAACPVRGVWELMSVSSNGKDQPLNGHKQLKIVTQRYWMWVGEDRSVTHCR